MTLHLSACADKNPVGRSPTGFLKNLAVPTFALVGTIIGLESLTTVFGMGTGVAFPVCSPEEARRTGRHGALDLDGLQEWRTRMQDAGWRGQGAKFHHAPLVPRSSILAPLSFQERWINVAKRSSFSTG